MTTRTAFVDSVPSVTAARELLGDLTANRRLLESCGGSGRGQYFRLSRDAYSRLVGMLQYYVDKRLDRQNVRARVLDTLRDRSLSNADVREITQMNRRQVSALMVGLARQGLVRVTGVKRGAKWVLADRS